MPPACKTSSDGEVTLAMTLAVHSSSVFKPKAGATDAERAYGGNPAGFGIEARPLTTVIVSEKVKAVAQK